jgi:hypothetical protein
MGTSIVSWVETYDGEGAWKAKFNCFRPDSFEKQMEEQGPFSEPFRNGHYGWFGFLAGVRNYACCEPLAPPRGFPDDCDRVGGCLANGVVDLEGLESCSWLMLSELLNFDYDQVFWNRRVSKGLDHEAVAEEGEGRHQTYRDFLGPQYFATLDVLGGLGEGDRVRVVFGFAS